MRPLGAGAYVPLGSFAKCDVPLAHFPSLTSPPSPPPCAVSHRVVYIDHIAQGGSNGLEYARSVELPLSGLLTAAMCLPALVRPPRTSCTMNPSLDPGNDGVGNRACCCPLVLSLLYACFVCGCVGCTLCLGLGGGKFCLGVAAPL